MPVVVGIRFKDSGKTYFFDPNGVEPLASGDHVIVETVRGLELAKVAHTPREVPDTEVVGELKPVVRRAEAADFERMRLLSARHDEVLDRCAENGFRPRAVCRACLIGDCYSGEENPPIVLNPRNPALWL